MKSDQWMESRIHAEDDYTMSRACIDGCCSKCDDPSCGCVCHFPDTEDWG
jgi:hypothetical protein